MTGNRAFLCGATVYTVYKDSIGKIKYLHLQSPGVSAQLIDSAGHRSVHVPVRSQDRTSHVEKAASRNLQLDKLDKLCVVNGVSLPPRMVLDCRL